VEYGALREEHRQVHRPSRRSQPPYDRRIRRKLGFIDASDSTTGILWALRIRQDPHG